MGNTTTTENDDNNDTSSNDKIVWLHVYQPPKDKQTGFGMVYHSGVEVYGSEYYYGGGSYTGTGIMVQKPKSKPKGGEWIYYQSIKIETNLKLSKNEVREIIAELRNDWLSKDYHISSKNCNHFSEALCQELCGKSIPGWVNRLAKVGNALSSAVGGDKIIKDIQDNQIISKNAALAADSYKGPPKPMIEYIPESKTIYLNNNYIDFTKCGSLNLNKSNMNNLKNIYTQDINNINNLIKIESECDEQMLLFIKFKKLIKLEAIGLALSCNNDCPKNIKLFANQLNIDFDDACDMDATKIIKINDDMRKNCKMEHGKFWAKSFKLKLTKFRNLQSLTVFVEDNFGDDVSSIIKIEFWGQD